MSEISKEEIKKSVEDLVSKLLTDSEDLEKGVNPDKVRGGDDDMKSGTPHTEKQEMMKAEEEEDKDEMEKAEDYDKMEEDEEKAKKTKKGMKKASPKEMSEDMKEDEESKVDMKKKKHMKKSQEGSEDAEETLVLDQEEVELVKAWRASKEEEGQEEVSKAQSEQKEDQEEGLAKAFKEENDSLKKALSEQSELIKSLTEKVEKIGSQPAYDKRSLSGLEPIEKSQDDESEEKISKAQVLDKMSDLQKAGKVRSNHIIEFEATGNISDPKVKQLVMGSFKN